MVAVGSILGVVLENLITVARAIQMKLSHLLLKLRLMHRIEVGNGCLWHLGTVFGHASANLCILDAAILRSKERCRSPGVIVLISRDRARI